MDHITPIDLQKANLTTSFRGYDKREVDELLKGAAKAWERVLEENVRMRQELESLRSESDMLRREEKFVHEALVTAQRTADEIRASAQKHAELLVEEAKQMAQAEKNSVRETVDELKWEIERLRQNRKRFADDYKMLLERHMRDLVPLADNAGASTMV